MVQELIGKGVEMYSQGDEKAQAENRRVAAGYFLFQPIKNGVQSALLGHIYSSFRLGETSSSAGFPLFRSLKAKNRWPM